MEKNKKYLRIENKFKYFLFLIVYFSIKPILSIIYRRDNKWLICERGFDAQDNGFIFFKYLVENHREIKPVFLIKKDSPEYDKVKNIGKTVEFGSFKHFLMAIGYKTKISTHLFGYAPWKNLQLFLRRNKSNDVHVFLQHGIIKNAHEGLCGDVCRALKLFVCGAKPEFDFISQTFKYKENVPQYLGLARYDNLLSFTSEKFILIMPTWREYLSKANDDVFEKTDFFINWNLLLKDSHFREQCLKNGYKIKFYLHPSFQKYSHLFSNDNLIEIVEFGSFTIQELLKRASLLITDFSSVYFDFAYMNKPLIYYQFDEETFYSLHYTKGYFDYRRDGFGDVCTTYSQVINSFDLICKNNFQNRAFFTNRSSNYFIFRDSKNCERIFCAIKKLV